MNQNPFSSTIDTQIGDKVSPINHSISDIIRPRSVNVSSIGPNDSDLQSRPLSAQFASTSNLYGYNIASSQFSDEEDTQSKTTLWMGDLDPWMDENFVKAAWAHYGEHVNVKMIRDKFTGMNSGYCFVDFCSHTNALKALLGLNGTVIPNTNKMFKLNWASGGGIVDKKEYHGVEYSIFVGDIGPEVTDNILLNTFKQHYPSCRTAKVVTDAMTGLSRGYGFVRFTEEIEQQRAMIEMQGQFCGSRPMRISMATPKNRFNNIAALAGMNYLVQQQQQTPQISDPNNTTVFVGGLTNGYVSEEELASIFAPFGPITYVKIPPGKGCGFVSFVHRQSAELAIAQLNGCLIGTNRVRLSWGRNNCAVSLSAPSSPLQSPALYSYQYQNQSVGNAVNWDQGSLINQNTSNSNQLFSTPNKFINSNDSSYSSTPFLSVGKSSSVAPSPYSSGSSIGFGNLSLNTDADNLKWNENELKEKTYDPITRPASSFANPFPSSNAYLSLPSIFGTHSAPNSPDASKKELNFNAGGNILNNQNINKKILSDGVSYLKSYPSSVSGTLGIKSVTNPFTDDIWN